MNFVDKNGKEAVYERQPPVPSMRRLLAGKIVEETTTFLPIFLLFLCPPFVRGVGEERAGALLGFRPGSLRPGWFASRTMVVRRS